MPKHIALFQSQEIRKIWHDDQWFFSVVDVVGALTESINPTDYLKKLRKRDGELGLYLGTNCPQVDMVTDTGKTRKTLAANTETLLRLIQSIPSPKAEPFKVWLAKVGYERMQEVSDPEIALNRSRELWQKHGRSEKWIQQRMTGQETRNKLTDYWSENGVEKGDEFAILTNIIHEEWTGIRVADHKDLKGLTKFHNLRDHMSEEELLFTALAELSTRKIAESMHTKGLHENKIPAQRGGQVAKNARKELEERTGGSVVTGENFLPPKKNIKKLK